MMEIEIKKGIQLICDTSKEIAKHYEDKDALIDKLNSLPKEDLEPVAAYYDSRSGAIIDLRKEVVKYLLDGNKMDEKKLEEFINKHRAGKEKQYQSYKNLYSMNSFQNFSHTFFQHNIKHAISNNPLKTTFSLSYLLASFLNPIFNHAKNRSIVPL